MKRAGKLREKLAEGWTSDSETLPLQPILELCGEGRVLIENHSGVTEYCPEKIAVRVGFGQVEIDGTNLRLCHMQGAQLVILGRIDRISVIRRYS